MKVLRWSIIILCCLTVILSTVTYCFYVDESLATTENINEDITYTPELAITYEVDESSNTIKAIATSNYEISKIELKNQVIEEEIEATAITDADTGKVEVIYQAENNTEDEETTEEIEYEYVLDESWVFQEDNLQATKEYTSNINETYLVTFVNEKIEAQEINILIESFEEITLKISTDGLDNGTSVVIIINEEDGTVEIISVSSDEYEEIAENGNLIYGLVTEEGIVVNTINTYLITLSTLSEDNQNSIITTIASNSEETTAEEATEEDNETTAVASSSDSSTSSSTALASSRSASSSSSSSSGSSSSTDSSTSSSTSTDSSTSSSSSSSDTSSSTDTSSTTTYDSSIVEYSSKAYEMLSYINSYRNNNGVSSCSWSSTLASYAMTRAKEIVSYYSHTRPSGGTALDWSPVYAENIGKSSFASASLMADTFQNSAAHSANILNSTYNTVGVGCVYGGDGYYYWVELFGL